VKHVVRLLAVALTGALAPVAQAQHRGEVLEDHHFPRELRRNLDFDSQQAGFVPSHYDRQPVRFYDNGNAGWKEYRSGNVPRHGHDQWSPLSRDSHYVVEIRRNYDAAGDRYRGDGHHYKRETHFDRRY
jgi:hypothetical protein